MRTGNSLVRWGWAAVVAAVVTVGMASEVSAGVVRIIPEQLRVVDPQSGFIMPQYGGATGSGGAVFWASVRLPVGARVTKLVYYHWGSVSGAQSSGGLMRTRLGQAPFEHDDVLMGAECDWYDANWMNLPPQAVSTTEPSFPESDLVVRPGYRYWVMLIVGNSSAGVGGAKVYYSR